MMDFIVNNKPLITDSPFNEEKKPIEEPKKEEWKEIPEEKRKEEYPISYFRKEFDELKNRLEQLEVNDKRREEELKEFKKEILQNFTDIAYEVSEDFAKKNKKDINQKLFHNIIFNIWGFVLTRIKKKKDTSFDEKAN